MEPVRTGTMLGGKAETKEELRFRQTAADTAGKLLEIEATSAPHGEFPPAHFHPTQDETFVVLAGTLTVRMHGREQRYVQGQSFIVPRGTIHTMVNCDATPTCVRWETRPALRAAEFFAAFYRLAQPDAPRGIGRVVRLLLLARRHRQEIVLTHPAPAIQNSSSRGWPQWRGSARDARCGRSTSGSTSPARPTRSSTSSPTMIAIRSGGAELTRCATNCRARCAWGRPRGNSSVWPGNES
jgi:quercetin dioxygenase-like cupin family protein